MRNYRTIEPKKRTVRDVFFLLAIAVALGLGLALASPALGAEVHGSMRQAVGGDITGSVSVTGGNAAGIAVELRQRSNGGEDKTLATTTTDAQGNYHFAGQASAPNDAFYYMKFSGGKGTLAAWYSFPIIYLSGSDFTVPTVEMADVTLLMPPGSTISLPSSLQWRARRSGETYRVFVYAQGDNAKAALDSGSLGMGTEYPLGEGALPEGSYEAIVQVRDAVVGYGQSQARFQFTVGKTASASTGQPTPELGVGGAPESPQQPAQPAQPQASPTIEAVAPTPAQPQPQPAQTETTAQSGPSLQLDLSANRSEVAQGESMIYKIEVTNKGDGVATGVVVTDSLPAGVTVDSATTRSTHGSIAVEGNNVTVQVGELAANTKAIVEIPVNVGKDAGANVSNQAVAQYQGAPAPVNSNAYIAQVAAPPAVPAPAQPQAPVKTEPQSPPASPPQNQQEGPANIPPIAQPQAPTESQPQAPPNNPPANPPVSQPSSPSKAQPQQPPANPPANTQQKPAAAIPQTGGGFPIVLALLILFVTLVARYLRGRSYRRT